MCACGRAAIWQRGRWFCAIEVLDGGCGYEERPPYGPWTPLCHCSERASFEREAFWCPRSDASGGCGFTVRVKELTEAEHPTLVRQDELAIRHARHVAATLTAAAYNIASRPQHGIDPHVRYFQDDRASSHAADVLI